MTRLVKKKTAQPEPDFLPHVHRIAALASEHKAENIVAYDLRGLTLIADSFVVCSAKSEPQLKAISNAVREGMKEVGVKPLSVEGTTSGGWLVMDYGVIIFHIFRPKTRDFYDLDGFWGDAPKIPLDLDDE